MMAVAYTYHAETRMRQRGIRSGDVMLILECGTQIDDETWFMRDQDVRREIERRKREIQVLGRLKRKKVVMRGEQIVTAYPSQPDDQKRTLRRGRRTGMAK